MAKRPRRTRKAPKPKQAKRDSRWITVRKPFDYHWPSRAVTNFHTPGTYCVKNEVADFAVQKGYATEGKEGDAAGTTAEPGTEPPVGDPGAADADRTADRPPVDSDAG